MNKVSYPRTGVTLKTSLLGMNPVGLSKMKMSKEYPKPTRASEYGILKPRTGVILRTSLLGMNPVRLSKMKMSKGYPKYTRASE